MTVWMGQHRRKCFLSIRCIKQHEVSFYVINAKMVIIKFNKKGKFVWKLTTRKIPISPKKKSNIKLCSKTYKFIWTNKIDSHRVPINLLKMGHHKDAIHAPIRIFPSQCSHAHATVPMLQPPWSSLHTPVLLRINKIDKNWNS